MSNHDTRVRECSTKRLEKICEDSSHELFDEAKKELSRRMNSKRDLKQVRQQRIQRELEAKLKKAQLHQEYSGDVRKMPKNK